MAPPARIDRLDDSAVLAALALGDPDGAAVFVRRFQRRVYGLAVTITGDAALAEDVAQQAFERAWRRADSYDARRGSVSTWLLAITRNLAIDTMRVHRARPLEASVIDELLAPADGPDPQRRAEIAEQTASVLAQLATLPPEQRRAVLLATVAGRTAAEIGELEGVPLGTAKTRIRTGLRKVRAALSEDAR